MMDKNDFLDAEADVSGEESNEEEIYEETYETKQKRKQEKGSDKDDDSENDEDDEEEDHNLLTDLIDDNPIEDDEDDNEHVVEGEGGDEEGKGRKRKHDEDSEEENDLDDDDYELIEENLGTRVDRSNKRKRVVVEDDEEDAEKEVVEPKSSLQDVLFSGGVGDESPRSQREPEEIEEGSSEGEEGGYEDEDEDDFIVYDEDVDQPEQALMRKKKKKRTYDDVAMQDAYDIFGEKFTFGDLGDLQEDEEEEEDEMDDEDSKWSKKKFALIEKIYEPGELERAHLTSRDEQVRRTDMPERCQLRGIAVCPSDDGELDEEAEWVYKHAFVTPPLSTQHYHNNDATYSHTKGLSTVSKIREALNLMRNQQFEVPFIAFYRKEYIDPELNITDLWRIFTWDEKWMQLRSSKKNLLRLFEQVHQYKLEHTAREQLLPSSFRMLDEEDIKRLRDVNTPEQLKDLHQHFKLYYQDDVEKMKELEAELKKTRILDGEEEEDDAVKAATVKRASRWCMYLKAVEAGICDVSSRFGLTAAQFGRNMKDNYQRYEVEQESVEPKELAAEKVGTYFSTVGHVLVAARHIVAMQIAHDPQVRACLRLVYTDRCKINVRPTRKGLSEIDENHPCNTYKYLLNKPIKELQDDHYLNIHLAEEDGLLGVEMSIDDKPATSYSYLDELKQLYMKDEYSMLAQEWNKERALAVEGAIKVLEPVMIGEVRSRLLQEAHTFVSKAACRKLYNWLKVAPYQVDQSLEDEDDEEEDASKGVRIMGISYSTLGDEASFACVIDGDGEVVDFLKLEYLDKRRNSWRKDEREGKERDLERLKTLISSKKPHVVAVAAECREILQLVDELKEIVAEVESSRGGGIGVELVDSDLAKVLSMSKTAEETMQEYPVMLRQAISLSRRLQDPLVEFSQLCNPDRDLLALKFHPLQDKLDKETLLESLYVEFVNRVNEVGVDVDRCISHSHTASLIQFVCGFGPRKGFHLLKTLKQTNSQLENRTQLVTHPNIGMGPKVFINCAGFIKIDTSAVVDFTDNYVEVLDGSRIHPETYEWARKMAVDALEYDDSTADANPAGALEEILESPERLKDLDLDAFAEELERQGYGNKRITLYDIRAELNYRYKDLRTPYSPPTVEERFNLLTKETPQTFYTGKSVLCRVIGMAHRRPQREQLDVANPVRNDETSFWQCPFCHKDDFPELNEVWSHFDTGECSGQAVGVRTMLDNGVSGYIPLKLLSNSKVDNPEDRVQINMMVNARIVKIDIERFNVELTCRSSDLIDADHKWSLPLDHFYDAPAELEDIKKQQLKKLTKKTGVLKRVIAHPSFKNFDYLRCEKELERMEQGDVIIRPSSKGEQHLTVSWKVGDGVVQHVDVREEGKLNSFSLGKCLWINDESYEDLDEIVSRFVQPLASLAREIVSYKYFKPLPDEYLDDREYVRKEILLEKKKNPHRIPYWFSLSKRYPSKFMLSYIPASCGTRHEFVTVTPDGIRFRGSVFNNLVGLVNWFKEHFNDPLPGQMIPATNNNFQQQQTIGNNSYRPPITSNPYALPTNS